MRRNRIIPVLLLPLSGLLLQSCLPPSLSKPDITALSLTSSEPGSSSSSSTPTSLQILNTAPLRGFMINSTQSITIQFDQNLLPASCVQGGTIGAATLSYSGATVTATPVTNWSAGISQTLSLSGCQDETAMLTGGGTMEFQVPAGTVYIDDAGNDLNPGTSAAPRRTINGALAVCASPCAILAAGGTYNRETVTGPGSFALIGGYSNDFSTWNSSLYPTRFADTSVPTGTAAIPDSALHLQGLSLVYLRSVQLQANADNSAQYVSALWSENTPIVAYAVQSTGCTGTCTAMLESTGIFMSGSGSMNLLLSTINGGNCNVAGCITSGIRDGATLGQVLNAVGTTFQGGTAANGSSSNGLLLTQAKIAGSRLEGCTISGGQSMYPRGALLTSFAGPVVRNTFNAGLMNFAGGFAVAAQFNTQADPINSNIFFGGIATTAGAVGTGNTVAAHCSNCTGQIVNNLFEAGRSSSATFGVYGLRLSGTSTPDLRNNEFTGWTGAAYNYCLFLDTASLPTAVKNNAFVECQTRVFRMGTSYAVCGGEIAAGGCTTELIAGTGDADNLDLAGSPGWISHNYTTLSFDYRFVSDGSALCSVTQGGQTILATDSDRSFQNRSAPWSIGPFEYDGACQ